MTTLIYVSNITKSFAYHQILADASFKLNSGQRLGLVGANGAGKTTLLRIITGEIKPDSGQITIAQGIRAGYLAQKLPAIEDRTVQDMIDTALADLRRMETRMRQLEDQMTRIEGDALDRILHEYGEISDRFMSQGGYEMEARTAIVLDGLQISHIPRDRALESLSGGEKSRMALAMLLLESPDVLLLDEPTNHLDFAMMTWLEGYLRSYPGAVLVVSHDREFLNQIVTTIVEIDEHSRTTRQYTGDYNAYRTEKARERERWQRDYAEQQEQIKQLQFEIKVGARNNNNYRSHGDGDKLLRNAKIAKHESTVASRIRRAEERLKRITDDPIPRPPEELQFASDFDARAFEGRMPLEVHHVSKAYGQQIILDDVSFALGRDQRIALVGPNGSGKSTLLRVLLGIEQPDSGEVYLSPAVKVGYLDQEQRLLDPDLPAFTAFGEGLPEFGTASGDQRLKAILLSMGLFRIDDLDKCVGQLSSGQQRKLQIARLIVGGYNLLVLDEPTNDVSFDVVEGLEAALRTFPGPIIAASHDRRFIQQLGGEVWYIQEGVIDRSASERIVASG